MSIKTEIIADSLNPKGNRLTTFVLEYPRFIHAEVMTHRVFSKNAASSRAIPIDAVIKQVMENPAMPVWWGKNQSGMQAKEELNDTIGTRELYFIENEYKELSKYLIKVEKYHDGVYYVYKLTSKGEALLNWLQARDEAVKRVVKLNEIGLHKQIANRILEPWFNIRIILSGTEFENFFALRAHPDAQPEFQQLATKMLEEYNKSTPKKLDAGEWHIPFGDKIDNHKLIWINNSKYDIESPLWHEGINELKIKIAIARCARVSYFNFEGKDDYEADIKLCDRLFGNNPKHLSPTEHVAMSINDSTQIGNFFGFKQYRKFFDDENLKDKRVVRKT